MQWPWIKNTSIEFGIRIIKHCKKWFELGIGNCKQQNHWNRGATLWIEISSNWDVGINENGRGLVGRRLKWSWNSQIGAQNCRKQNLLCEQKRQNRYCFRKLPQQFSRTRKDKNYVFAWKWGCISVWPKESFHQNRKRRQYFSQSWWWIYVNLRVY